VRGEGGRGETTSQGDVILTCAAELSECSSLAVSAHTPVCTIATTCKDAQPELAPAQNRISTVCVCAHTHLIGKESRFHSCRTERESELMSPDGCAHVMMDKLTKSKTDLHDPRHTQITPSSCHYNKLATTVLLRRGAPSQHQML